MTFKASSDGGKFQFNTRMESLNSVFKKGPQLESFANQAEIDFMFGRDT